MIDNHASSEITKSKKQKSKGFWSNFYIFLLENDPKTYSEAMSSIEALFQIKKC